MSARSPTDGGISVEICIPIYRDDPSALIAQLSRLRGADEAMLRIYDDGSADPALTARIEQALRAFPGQTALMTVPQNLGRAAARNALMAAAHSDWLLFLDGDMRIDREDFLRVYQQAARAEGRPCCIVGGFGVDRLAVTRATRLHALQSVRSECLDAARRRADPGRYVFTANIFFHRQLCRDVPFNNRFSGWGWEDVDWGLSVADHYPIRHIDNPAVHLGLDEDAALLGKYEGSGGNFLLMLDEHPDSVRRMPVYRMARALSRLPFRRSLTWAMRRAVLSGRPVLPARLRLVALKLFRVSVYAQALHARDH
ncbi:glycosyltransferase family A protein [Paracoccus aminophilus]|nr:glycosyltransferase family A protein [Paracoccus aminophilus]